MRVPKLLLAVCAATVCAGFISVRAQDNRDQAAARAALEQKMRELDAQSSQTNAAPVVPQNETPPAQPAPHVRTVQTPVPSAAAVSTPPTVSDKEAQDQARAALEQKMRELDLEREQQKQGAPILVNSSGAVVVEVQTNQPAPEMAAPTAAQSVITPSPGGSSLFAPATPASPDAEAQTAAQAALQQKMAEQPDASETRSTLFSSSPSPANAAYAGKEPGFQPIVAPPLPISAGKEAQLQALNARYMANQIPPAEYFKQRAQILAAP